MGAFPSPKSLQLHAGNFRISTTATFHADSLARDAAAILQERLAESNISSLKEASIDPVFRWKTDTGLGTGHCISITHDAVLVRAATADAFHSASATLFLLFFWHRAQKSIPCQRIEDAPKYHWRGCHFDCARHFFPIRFLKKIIELCSLMKINVFHFHFCDDQGWRIPIPEFPRLTEIGAWRKEGDRNHGGFYTEEEIISLIRYAEKRGVEIVPECEMPGHCAAALVAYPSWAARKLYQEVPSTWGIFEDAYNIADSKLRKNLKRILAYLMQLFPSTYFHLGGDELPPKVLDNAIGSYSSTQALQEDFFTDMCTFLTEGGKTPVVWDEVFAHAVPKNVLGMTWRDAAQADAVIQKGHKIVLCLQDRGCYLDHGYRHGPHELGRLSTCSIAETAKMRFPKLDETMVLGAQAAIWTEGMSSEWEAEQLIFPRLFILAQRFWTDTKFPQDSMQALLGLLEHFGVYYYKP